MKFRLGLSVLALAVCAAIPSQSNAQPTSAPRTVSATVAHAPVPAQSTAPLAISLVTLAGFAIGSTRDLSKTYLFNGITYGPGEGIEVPDDFPELDEDTGDVIHPAGSEAARNQARARSFSSPPSTGGVNTGEGGSRSVAENSKDTVSGKSRVQLEKMDKDDLVALASRKEVEVTRADGADGEPLKSDYIEALSAPAAAE